MALDSYVCYVAYATGGAAAKVESFTLGRITANRRMAAVGANGTPDGVFYEPAENAGDVVAIADWHMSQSLRVRAGGAIADGHYVRADGNGKAVSDGAAGTANSIGKCIGGAGAEDEIVQIVPIPDYGN